jgi:hypothetical protein
MSGMTAEGGRAALLLALVAAILAAVLFAPQPEALAAKEKGNPGNLFVLSGQSGRLDRSSGNHRRFRLVARDPQGDVTSFTDRPGRAAGHMKVGTFIRRWNRLGFKDEPPNAALVIADAPHSRNVLVVELSKPNLLPGDAVAFTARVLKGSATGALSRFRKQADKRVAAHFGDFSLFIDPSGQPNGTQFILKGLTNPGGFLVTFSNASLDRVGSSVSTSGPTDLFAFSYGLRIQPRQLSADPGTPIDANVSIFVDVDPGVKTIRGQTELPAGASGTVTVSYKDDKGFDHSYTLPILSGRRSFSWPITVDTAPQEP